MTIHQTLFTTTDPVTSTTVSLIEARTGLLTEYNVILRQRSHAPEIRTHATIDDAVRDYVGTVAGEVATLGSDAIQEEFEGIGKYTSRDFDIATRVRSYAHEDMRL